jgi:hypothetical protein
LRGYRTPESDDFVTEELNSMEGGLDTAQDLDDENVG